MKLTIELEKYEKERIQAKAEPDNRKEVEETGEAKEEQEEELTHKGQIEVEEEGADDQAEKEAETEQRQQPDQESMEARNQLQVELEATIRQGPIEESQLVATTKEQLVEEEHLINNEQPAEDDNDVDYSTQKPSIMHIFL